MLQINPKKFGVAGGIVWGAWLAILTILGSFSCYGHCFLKAIGCLIPCYSISICGAILAFIFGFIHAFVMLFLMASIYNEIGSDCKKKK